MLLLAGMPRQFFGRPLTELHEQYEQIVQGLRGTSAHAETHLPTIGVEIISTSIT